MGQSNSSEATGPTYVPIYQRPKWPDQDWHITLDLRPDGVLGKEVGYSKLKLDDFTKKLKVESESKDIDSYLRQRIHDLIGTLTTNVNSQQHPDKSLSGMSRLQRTFSYLRPGRTSRSSNPGSSQRSHKDAVSRTRSHDVTPSRPLLEKETPQRTTVHQFDLTPVLNPIPLEPILDASDYRQQLINLANSMKLSKEDTNTNTVCEEVKRTVDDSEWYLKKAYKAFKDVQIISAGSIADGTKILSANEFDFVILMPHLEESVKEIKVLEDTENEYIRLKLIHENTEDNKSIVSNVNEESAESLIRMVVDAFKSFLRPGWMVVSTESKSFVTRMHFEHETPDGKETVRFDFSLAVPVSSNKVIPVDIDNPEEVVELPLWNFLMESLQKYDGKIFALIHHQSHGFSRRISLALAEKELMFEYGETNGVIECLALCKAFVALFFPLVLVEDSWEAYVPAYLLKNAIFFLMSHYNDREKWEGDEMFFRVVEVFKLLQKSLGEEGFGSRGSRIALFVFPGFISLPEFSIDSCRFVPGRLELRDSMTHSFHEGQITYRCEFPLAEKLDGLLETTDANGVLGNYVRKLRTTDWNFRELLVGFISLLDDLFQYKATVPWVVEEKNNNRSK